MTDNSLALYRKYRPATFDEVRNQDHIINVLKGALVKGRVPHALLFTGGRGTGKTTVARIFAKAIGAHDVDISEIDAASNRGIDDIRELRDAVHTVPFESPYKVYIIDEVHMLTKEAFNALLKTLEEPPQHVVFILATTERDKLLDTITSRCQVFEFRSPTREELRDTVIAVMKKEKCTLGEGAADIIALAADGSYRDALGIAEKVMMAGGDTVLTADEVAIIVGAPKNVLLRDLVVALSVKDVVKALLVLESVVSTRVDMKLFYTLLLERIRTVIMLRYNPKVRDALTSKYGAEDADILSSLAAAKDSSINSRLVMSLIDSAQYVGKTILPELPLEMVIIEHCS